MSDIRCDVCLDNGWRLCKKCPHTEKIDKKKLNIFDCERCRITKFCDKHMDCVLDVYLEGIKRGKANLKKQVGRPNEGGDQVKKKFYSTVSCVVLGINKKRSISLGLYEGLELVGVGNCTLPNEAARRELEEIVVLSRTVVEIKYLYAYKGGSLYQPIYIGPREDINLSECVVGQLKYKSEQED